MARAACGSARTKLTRGYGGSPKGRPVGARNRLAEAFLKDVLADWEEHGAGAVRTFRDERLHDYVKMVAGLLPREFDVKANELDELTDEQLARELRGVVAELTAAGVALEEGDATPEGPEPTDGLPALR